MTRICIEHHYTDGDVGVDYLTQTSNRLYNLEDAILNWFKASDLVDPNSLPSHLVIRRDDEAGQALSNSLMEAAAVYEETGLTPRQLLDRFNQVGAALRWAHNHLDMGALKISHCKDAARIEGALSLLQRNHE